MAAQSSKIPNLLSWIVGVLAASLIACLGPVALSSAAFASNGHGTHGHVAAEGAAPGVLELQSAPAPVTIQAIGPASSDAIRMGCINHGHSGPSHSSNQCCGLACCMAVIAVSWPPAPLPFALASEKLGLSSARFVVPSAVFGLDRPPDFS